MKKFSVIIASLVLFAGMTFAQTSTTVQTGKKAPASGTKGGSSSGTTSGTTSSAPVKKVPPTTKGPKAVPAVDASKTK